MFINFALSIANTYLVHETQLTCEQNIVSSIGSFADLIKTKTEEELLKVRLQIMRTAQKDADLFSFYLYQISMVERQLNRIRS